MTILSFVAVFAALGLGTAHPEPLAAAILVLGVFVGSAALVAHAERRRQPVPLAASTQAARLGEPDLGRDHHRVWDRGGA